MNTNYEPEQHAHLPPLSGKQSSANVNGVDVEQLVKENLILPRVEGRDVSFTPISLAELIRRPPKPWLIDGIVGPQDIGMIYGPPGSGKTFIVIDLIFSACLGRQFALQFNIARPLTVAYCAGEGLSGLPARFAAAAQYYGVDDLNNFQFFELVPQLFFREPAPATPGTVVQFVNEWQSRHHADSESSLDILIIDTLHSATIDADENSAKDMGRILQLVKLTAGTLGCAVLLVHHTNKAGTGERGSSALRGAMDVMLEVKQVARKYAMTCEKLKDGESWKPRTFDLVAKAASIRVWWDQPSSGDLPAGKQTQDKESIVKLLQAHPGIKYTARALGQALGMGASKQIFKLLRSIVDENGNVISDLKDPTKDASPHNPLMYWWAPSDTDDAEHDDEHAF